MDVKDEVLLKLFNKSKFRNATKTFLHPKFLSINIQILEISVSAPLSCLNSSIEVSSRL